ncbi:hypothetical protein OH76DRAFT_1423728 [Lentinus brumalis]|uniref:Uncharacterized protein n=1 Tax=Lentinus brumalis TaxID=2498619 RepID=A0A371CJC1_9APHY|nr:hypothetical protein OH76DRAFT_1423728 [Polyporus brumalis]
MSSVIPRTPAKASTGAPSTPRGPSKPPAAKFTGPSLTSSGSDYSSLTSSPMSPLTSPTPSPISSPSPGIQLNVASLMSRGEHGGGLPFVSARQLYDEQQVALGTTPVATGTSVGVDASVSIATQPVSAEGGHGEGEPVLRVALPTHVVTHDSSKAACAATADAATGSSGTGSAVVRVELETHVVPEQCSKAASAATGDTAVTPAQLVPPVGLAQHGGTVATGASGTGSADATAIPSSWKGKQPEARPQADVATADCTAVPSVGNNVPLHDTTVDFGRIDQTASTSNANVASVTASSRLAMKLEYARVAAAAREWYLAQGASLQSLTTWYQNGRGKIRVSAVAAAHAVEAQAAHAAEPDMVPCPAPPSAAGYGTIGQIEDDWFFARCDGNYRGPTQNATFNRSFAQTTLMFALGPPPRQYPSLVTDYDAALGTLVSLLPPNSTVRSGHVYEGKPEKHLRLRHTVFERQRECWNGGGTTDRFRVSIEGWPCYTDEAIAARDALVETHVARPLPAYDVLGNLIPPSRYHIDLRRATVLVVFSMTHYDIAQRRNNGGHSTKCTLCLDVQYIRVLIPPAQYSPVKRSNIHLSDPTSYRTKKARV